VLNGLLRSGANELFQQICPAGDAEFFGHHAERIFRRDKVDAGNALVGFKCTKRLAGKDCAGCAGDGEGEGEVQLPAPSYWLLAFLCGFGHSCFPKSQRRGPTDAYRSPSDGVMNCKSVTKESLQTRPESLRF
jgi:hypothetical protein